MTDLNPVTHSDPATGTRKPATPRGKRRNASASAAVRASLAAKTAITGGDAAARVMACFTPPDIWVERRPSLRELWLYGAYGAQAGSHGPARGWARAWVVLIALPLAVAVYYLVWLAERPTRLAAALLLYAVIAHTGIGGWLPRPTWLP